MAIHQSPDPSPHADASGVPDLSQLGAILRERGWIVGVCATAGLLAAGIHTKRMPVAFEAASVLQWEPHSRVLGFDAENAGNSSSEPGLQTILEAFRSRALLERTATDLKLYEDRSFCPVQITLQQAQNILSGCLEVKQRRGTQLIDITARHADAGVAQKLANGVAKSFIQLQLDLRSSGARSVMEFLLTEAERLKKRLQKSEEALQTYKETNEAASLEDRQDTVTTTLKVQGNNLAEARGARIRLESDVADMQRFQGKPEELLAIASIAQHPSIVALRSQIQELEGRISTLRLVYTAKHPKMIQAHTQLRSTEDSLRKTVLEIPETLKTDLERALGTERNFEAALKEQEKQALALNRQSINFKVLARDVDTDRALYESILRKLKETDVARGVQLSDLRIFESASLPGAPAPRPTMKFLALGFFAGLMVGSATVLGSCLMEGAWRSAEEIEAATGLPVLSTVPRLEGRGAAFSVLQGMSDPSQPVLEAFRSLRTSLHLSARKRGKNCFLFTSALPDDGKSFCSIGYAVTLARQGVRTLLVDADLRSPSLEMTIFGSKDRRGLADVLDGSTRLSHAIVQTSSDGLDLLPAGKVLLNASELLTRKGIRTILNTARERYDCIVIDSAPVQSVSDAMLLAEAVDTVCLVVRYATTPRKAAMRAIHLFQDRGTPVEGIVFNGANPTSVYGDYASREPALRTAGQ
jgi:capsular exopolysaccharide synthesis family protein